MQYTTTRSDHSIASDDTVPSLQIERIEPQQACSVPLRGAEEHCDCECPIHVVGGSLRGWAIKCIIGGVLTGVISRGSAGFGDFATQMPNEWLIMFAALAGLIGAATGFTLGMARLFRGSRANHSSVLILVLTVTGLVVGLIAADPIVGRQLALNGFLSGLGMVLIQNGAANLKKRMSKNSCSVNRSRPVA